jgi:curved DNA-binding protein CbpA
MAELDPLQILGLTPNAGEEEIRAAYVSKVKEFPPERSPAEFERVRDAYELLRDPRLRARQILSADPAQSLPSLLPEAPPERCYTGPEPWLRVVKGSQA